MTKIESRRLLLILLFCIAQFVISSGTKTKNGDIFDRYLFKTHEQQQKMLKDCYQIIVDWKEGYSTDEKL